jgi:hypothetical protein
LTAEELGGFLGLEACANVLGFGVCLGIEIGGALDRLTKKIKELYGAIYITLGKITVTTTVTLTPIGCGSNLYRKWDVGFSLNFYRDSRFKRLRFDKTVDLFNIQIGSGHTCARIRILSSVAPKQCIDTEHQYLTCDEHAAMPGVRLGDDPHDHEFKVSTDGGRVCIERTDEESGWGMDFSIRCAADDPGDPGRRLAPDVLKELEAKVMNRSQVIKMGSSIQNGKCVYSEPGTVCSAVNANSGRRLARDNKISNDTHDDSFNITVKGLHENQVCVQRIDKNEGWNLDLRFLCYINTASVSEVVVIGSSRKRNTKCVNHAAPVICKEDSGNAGFRLAERDNVPSIDKYEETFHITVSSLGGRSQVCATRKDKPGGWGLSLRLLCLHDDQASRR